MTFSVQALTPTVTCTVVDYDGTSKERTFTHAVFGYVQGERKMFAMCEDSSRASAISSLLQGAEYAKPVL